MDDFGERSQAVGGARGIGDDVEVSFVVVVVDSVDEERGVVFGRGGDDDFLGSTGEMFGGSFGGQELSC